MERCSQYIGEKNKLHNNMNSLGEKSPFAVYAFSVLGPEPSHPSLHLICSQNRIWI